jgi:hypothetical protein
MLYSPATPGDKTTQIICCSSSAEIQRALTLFLRPKDDILSFGADNHPDVSALLIEKSQQGELHSAVFCDKHTKLTKKKNATATATNENIEYVTLQELSDWKRSDALLYTNTTDKQQQQQQRRQFQVLLVSVGHLLGHDLPLTNLSLVHELMDTYTDCRTVILKSKSLYSVSRRFLSAQKILAGDGSTDYSKETQERSSTPFLIPSVGVEEYRKTIPFVVQESDSVIELGCHYGRTTKLLNDASGCIGVDIGPKIIQHAKRQYPDIEFHVASAWSTMDLLKLSPGANSGFDIVYADIGGLSGPDGLLESLALLDALGNALQPKCIVIKSLCMQQFSAKLQFFPVIWDKVLLQREQDASSENN